MGKIQRNWKRAGSPCNRAEYTACEGRPVLFGDYISKQIEECRKRPRVACPVCGHNDMDWEHWNGLCLDCFCTILNALNFPRESEPQIIIPFAEVMALIKAHVFTGKSDADDFIRRQRERKYTPSEAAAIAELRKEEQARIEYKKGYMQKRAIKKRQSNLEWQRKESAALDAKRGPTPTVSLTPSERQQKKKEYNRRWREKQMKILKNFHGDLL